MHLTVLLVTGGALVFMVARVLATPGADLHDRLPPGSAIAVGLSVGVVGALIALSTQVDMIPDDVEASILPVAIVIISAAIAVVAWYRTFRH